ncbi:unnamed protein product [Lactuca virosa]|uniref:Uncharacterized protein n=1 Tax=Lactuca virosa TaxID=75947 RepID=A0AAU9NF70_9ASTR|nr:unnamed protein product [Lactuca virosa]
MKHGKGSKKSTKVAQPKSDHVTMEKEVTKPVQDLVVHETQKGVVPSKTRVLKRTKKPAYMPHHSPERPIVEEILEKLVSTPKESVVSKFKKIL